MAKRVESDTILLVVDRHPNLADPDFEPSDEELIGLAKRAFAGLREAENARVDDLRRGIARARDEALARLARGSPR